jgi:uncharacterized phage protein (TIGR01671 family)
MRTIKFRGKTIDNKWVYGDLIQIGGGALIYHGDKQTVEEIPQEDSPCAVGFYPNEISPVKPDTVGQFTGLFDKNGIEIYEGDKLKGFEYPVTFEDGSFCATIQYDLVRCWLNSDCCNLENLEIEK